MNETVFAYLVLRPYVAVVPPKRYSGIAFQDFSVAEAKHRARLWYGRVELFFTCIFEDQDGVTPPHA
jgi:hypothetical protein